MDGESNWGLGIGPFLFDIVEENTLKRLWLRVTHCDIAGAGIGGMYAI
jgi:hypothetical protein